MPFFRDWRKHRAVIVPQRLELDEKFSRLSFVLAVQRKDQVVQSAPSDGGRFPQRPLSIEVNMEVDPDTGKVVQRQKPARLILKQFKHKKQVGMVDNYDLARLTEQFKEYKVKLHQNIVVVFSACLIDKDQAIPALPKGPALSKRRNQGGELDPAPAGEGTEKTKIEEDKRKKYIQKLNQYKAELGQERFVDKARPEEKTAQKQAKVVPSNQAGDTNKDKKTVKSEKFTFRQVKSIQKIKDQITMQSRREEAVPRQQSGEVREIVGDVGSELAQLRQRQKASQAREAKLSLQIEQLKNKLVNEGRRVQELGLRLEKQEELQTLLQFKDQEIQILTQRVSKCLAESEDKSKRCEQLQRRLQSREDELVRAAGERKQLYDQVVQFKEMRYNAINTAMQEGDTAFIHQLQRFLL